jgi:hypothetical protein
MAKRPRLIEQHLGNTPVARDLLARVREQQELLDRVRSMLQPPLDQHCQAAVINAGQLLLYTDSPAWSSRLRFFSRQLGNRLRQANLPVDSIVIRVMIMPTSRRRERTSPRNLSSANAALIQAVADEISDPKLSDALKRLGKHSR